MTLDQMPDDTMVSLGWVRKHFTPLVGGEARDMTARECAAEFGHSRDWWQDRARAGEISGAYQAGERSRWYIPRDQASLFLRTWKASRRRKHVARRPYKGPQAA